MPSGSVDHGTLDERLAKRVAVYDGPTSQKEVVVTNEKEPR
jgi:hypothetical protein